MGVSNERKKKMNTTLSLKCHHCEASQRVSVNYEDVQAWKDGALIQDALPYLNADQRELLISKTCGPCFDKMFDFGD
jgi:hypothetical protein